MAKKVNKTANKETEGEQEPSRQVSTDFATSFKDQVTGRIKPAELSDFIENDSEPMGSGIMTSKHSANMAAITMKGAKGTAQQVKNKHKAPQNGAVNKIPLNFTSSAAKEELP